MIIIIFFSFLTFFLSFFLSFLLAFFLSDDDIVGSVAIHDHDELQVSFLESQF